MFYFQRICYVSLVAVCLISRQAISQYISRKYQYVMFVVLNYCIQNIHSSKLECQFFKVSIIKVVISYMLWFTDFSSFCFRLCFHGFIENILLYPYTFTGFRCWVLWFENLLLAYLHDVVSGSSTSQYIFPGGLFSVEPI